MFAMICLGAATGLAYWLCDPLFLSTAARSNPEILRYMEIAQMIAQMTKDTKVAQSYFALEWTAIIAVKFSFLTFFKALFPPTSRKLIIYYWITVAVTIITWMFVVSEPFIACPNYGEDTLLVPFSNKHTDSLKSQMPAG